MSAPVDALAVLDHHANGFSNGPVALSETGAANLANELREARAAVADVIEAAAEVRAAHRELPSTDHPADVRQAGEARIGRAHYALEAALARVQGGAQ